MDFRISLMDIVENLGREELLKLIAVEYAIDNYCDINDDDRDFEEFDHLIDGADDLLIAIQNTLANVDREFEIGELDDEEEDYEETEDYEEEDDEFYSEDDTCDCSDCHQNDKREAAMQALRDLGFDTSDIDYN